MWRRATVNAQLKVEPINSRCRRGSVKVSIACIFYLDNFFA